MCIIDCFSKYTSLISVIVHNNLLDRWINLVGLESREEGSQAVCSLLGPESTNASIDAIRPIYPFNVTIQTHEAHQTRISRFIRQISNTNLAAHNAVTIWHCGPQTAGLSPATDHHCQPFSYLAFNFLISISDLF